MSIKRHVHRSSAPHSTSDGNHDGQNCMVGAEAWINFRRFLHNIQSLVINGAFVELRKTELKRQTKAVRSLAALHTDTVS